MYLRTKNTSINSFSKQRVEVRHRIQQLHARFEFLHAIVSLEERKYSLAPQVVDSLHPVHVTEHGCLDQDTTDATSAIEARIANDTAAKCVDSIREHYVVHNRCGFDEAVHFQDLADSLTFRIQVDKEAVLGARLDHLALPRVHYILSLRYSSRIQVWGKAICVVARAIAVTLGGGSGLPSRSTPGALCLYDLGKGLTGVVLDRQQRGLLALGISVRTGTRAAMALPHAAIGPALQFET
mmetsp:Transcript_84752/g.171867  ORF Transcript_84752/g.171867 Transcript_84752/m.171867 type:complete len:239 (+) Transcript_84752:768-1484(+)